MDYDEAVMLTEELRAKGNATFSASEKHTIQMLYEQVLGKAFRITSCQQCYHDAVIEITLYLRKNKSMATPSKYKMRAGFIIACPNFHNGTIYTNDNLTDEIAAEYLEKYPQNASMFATIPEKAILSTSNDAKGDEVGNLPSKARKAVRGKNKKK